MNLERCLKVVVPERDKRKKVLPDPSEANSGQCGPPGTQKPPGDMASRRGGHRGRRPDHDDTGIAREHPDMAFTTLAHLLDVPLLVRM